jgi:hypothetical protein
MYWAAMLSIGSLVSAGTALAQTPEDDFAARCAAAGVVKCVGFDNTTTDIVRGSSLQPDGLGQYRARLDTANKASGAGSLVFELPPPPHAGANIGGQWRTTGPTGMGALFGQNSVFYVQFRMRLTEDMLTNTWDSYWKTILIHYNQQTCGSIELATVNEYMGGRPAMYTDCGARHFYTNLSGQYTESTPLLTQQGDYRCQYGQVNRTTCLFFEPNQWVTFLYKVTIGTWDQPNSTVEAFVAREGDTQYRQWIKVPNFALSCNTDPCSQSPGRDQGYNNITLTPYMTGLSTSAGKAGVVSRLWFDELIVSTRPIAVPGAGTAPADTLAPAAPTGIRTQ